MCGCPLLPSTLPDPSFPLPPCSPPSLSAVQANDFMFGIASIFRVSLADLLAVNPGFSEGSYLQAGQHVRIPPFTTACGNGKLAPAWTGTCLHWQICSFSSQVAQPRGSCVLTGC